MSISFKKLILAVVLLLLACQMLPAQNVTNIVAEQVEKTIHVSYDLDRQADIKLLLSTDGGKSFTELHRVSGDVGKDISAGHRTIVWDVLSERDRLVGEDFVFKVKAQEYENLTFTVNGVMFKMIYVKGGTFQMGATFEQGSDADGDRTPVHSVRLSDYYMSETEVTQALWKAVMGSNPSCFKGDNLPVEEVSYDIIVNEFLPKLNRLTGKTFRLPTEAEWEYAARGGGRSGGYKYSGSNSIDAVAWYNDNSGSETHDVGTKQPNELGLYDMSGNVWEWCSDWYGSYGSGAQTNPIGPASGSYRVMRGSGWYGNVRNWCVSSRNGYHPYDRDSFIGFRLSIVHSSNNGTSIINSSNNGTSITDSSNNGTSITDSSNNGMSTIDSSNNGLLKFTVKGVMFKMVYVKGGTFQMGATSEQGSDADRDEKPVHSVTLSDYYIGKTEVTQALWKAVMGSNPSYFIGGDSLPVENVSYEDIVNEFIPELNRLTGKTFRLPTEAEWEYAARGGYKSKGYKYSGSDNINAVAWYRNNASTTHVVGTKKPNKLGLYDMTGNVMEWCSDWYGSYDSGVQTDPEGPTYGSRRVLRGGSWRSLAMFSRVSTRDSGIGPFHYSFGVCGFRLSMEP